MDQFRGTSRKELRQSSAEKGLLFGPCLSSFWPACSRHEKWEFQEPPCTTLQQRDAYIGAWVPGDTLGLSQPWTATSNLLLCEREVILDVT